MERQSKQFPDSKSLKLKKPSTKVGAASAHGASRDVYSFENGKNNELTDSEYYTLALSKL